MTAPVTRRVVLVCVAGISSTFLARRMRGAAPGLQVTVADVRSLAEVLPGTDAVLVAPQLAGSLDEVRLIAAGLPVALMPDAPSSERHLVAVAALDALLAAPSAPVLAPVKE